jgi:hypothetical protein
MKRTFRHVAVPVGLFVFTTEIFNVDSFHGKTLRIHHRGNIAQCMRMENHYEIKVTRGGVEEDIVSAPENTKLDLEMMELETAVVSSTNQKSDLKRLAKAFKEPAGDDQKRQHTMYQKKKNMDMELREMEKDIVGSTNAKLDLKRIANALESSDPESNLNPEMVANTAAPWQLATAAAVTASVATFVATTNSILASIVFIGSFLAAIGDPVEEEGLAGPVARLLGRETIKSVESSKPKIRAVVRAAVTDEETIMQLQEEVTQLREENASLRLWKEKRVATEMLLAKYTMDELRELERRHRLPSSIIYNSDLNS